MVNRMQKREPPAFQEYPASILAERNFRLMSLHERGLLFTIRLECWVNGSVPSLPDELAKYLGLNPTDVKSSFTDCLKHYLKEDQGSFRSAELDNYKEHLEEIRKRKSEGGKKSAKNKKEKLAYQSTDNQLTSQDTYKSLVKDSVVKTSQEQSLEKDVIDKAWVDDYENGDISF
jgi:hypothetical protein